MTHKNLNLYYSLLAALCLVPTAGHAAGIRVGNLSRSNAQGYQQVNETRYAATAAAAGATAMPSGATTASPSGAIVDAAAAATNLPIRVANQDLATRILNGDTTAGVDVEGLNKCAAIYPNGEFEWATPMVGMGAGGPSTCVSVIEMRAIGAGPNGTDAVVARANLAAGDSFKCNISEFPEDSYLPAAGNVTFPNDNEPTMEDVVNVLNEEQKQNAGLKIAAGAVMFGLAGNAAGDNELGKDSLLGTGKDKMQSTLVGALGGAALMAASSYSGKVAGDVILSTGVNAAAGGVMGNIMASGNRVLRIEKCSITEKDSPKPRETTCLWGVVEERGTLPAGAEVFIAHDDPTYFKVCTTKDGKQTCESKDITVSESNEIIKGYQWGQLTNNTKTKTLEDYVRDNFASAPDASKYMFKEDKMTQGHSGGEGQRFYKLNDGVAHLVSKRTPAMIIDVQDKGMGYDSKDWTDLKSKLKTAGKKIVGRTGIGIATSQTFDNIDWFKPVYLDAEDGGIIDLDNKARKKDTLIGAGVGGAMGAFSGYQGAQSDIEERWVSEVRAYKDSLQKIYCATGTRFMSYYNDVVVVPGVAQ